MAKLPQMAVILLTHIFAVRLDTCKYTLPTVEIISAKNARAWVSMVLYLKKNYAENTKKIVGAV